MSGRVCGLLLLAVACACGPRDVDPGEIPGLYRMQLGTAEDIVVLCADSAWQNRYRAPGVAEVAASGSYEVVSTSYGDRHVLLRGYPGLWKTSLPSRDPRRAEAGATGGYAAMLVERGRGGAVRLIVDVDGDRAYLRDGSVSAEREAAQACSQAARSPR